MTRTALFMYKNTQYSRNALLIALIYSEVVPCQMLQGDIALLSAAAATAVLSRTPRYHSVMLHCPRPQEALADTQLCCKTHMEQRQQSTRSSNRLLNPNTALRRARTLCCPSCSENPAHHINLLQISLNR